MLIVLPVGLTWLLQYMFSESPVPPTGPIFNTIGPRIMGLFPLILMFLITSITMLRERQSGTLERLMVGPTGKADVILGYALAFGLVATVQAIVMTAWSVWPLGLEIPTGLGASGSSWFSMLSWAPRWASWPRPLPRPSSRPCR